MTSLSLRDGVTGDAVRALREGDWLSLLVKFDGWRWGNPLDRAHRTSDENRWDGYINPGECYAKLQAPAFGVDGSPRKLGDVELLCMPAQFTQILPLKIVVTDIVRFNNLDTQGDCWGKVLAIDKDAAFVREVWPRPHTPHLIQIKDLTRTHLPLSVSAALTPEAKTALKA